MTPLQHQLRDACKTYPEFDVQFREDYSGRGMYGRRCVGIVGRPTECRAILARVICDLREDLKTVQMGSSEEESDRVFQEAVDTLLDYATDSMGMGGQIFYWSELEPWPEEEPAHDGQPDEAQEWHDFDPDC